MEQAPVAPLFCGRWKKQPELCDSMDAALDAVCMPWIYRKAIHFLDTIEIHLDGSYLVLITKAGGILDIAEKYRLDGETFINNRRDQRRGQLAGSLQNYTTDSFSVT